MKRLEFKEGDACWIHIGGEGNPLIEGKVIHVFEIKEYTPTKYYVIDLPTGIDGIYEVRNGFQMSDSEYLPIGIWRNA